MKATCIINLCYRRTRTHTDSEGFGAGLDLFDIFKYEYELSVCTLRGAYSANALIYLLFMNTCRSIFFFFVNAFGSYTFQHLNSFGGNEKRTFFRNETRSIYKTKFNRSKVFGCSEHARNALNSL